MENQLKELFGAWIQAIGTVTAAVGSTPSLNEDTQENLNLWGNVLQGTGNALIADAQEGFTLEKLGNEVQAIGNTTVVAGILLNISEENKLKLDINGNLLQAVGGGIALPEDLLDEPSTIRTLNIAGNVLQIVGNSMQALAGAEELKSIRENKDKFKGYRENNESKQDSSSEELAISGSWIQAVGSVISAIAQTKESIEEIN
ncbi:hypothetical protein P5G62_008070 [Neobacillus sp. 179-C4.2 HS]|uniref:Uncharacterized protein n=1 Tax=Neobacillus driksii TaxID=3035913 RepID=A0ABV4YRC6_9BACI|nr:hypothetical protein [Neobacillus sp. 179.-C4.2 HS]MDP5196935.1 hypothetical protein [Neobacillus sp. 179.-C4.2 HS]